MMIRNFLNISDLNSGQLQDLLDRSLRFKQDQINGFSTLLAGKIIALYMELPSTRTRLSFQVAAIQTGANLVNIDQKSVQIDRGEPIEDFARICSGLFSAIVIRALSHQRIEEFVRCADIPIINALSSRGHPCQVLADLMTLAEIADDLRTLNIVWLGDATNICRSWIEAAGILGLNLRISTPATHQPDPQSLPDSVSLFTDNPKEAVIGADVVMTDVWSSMGEAVLSEQQKQAFMPYQINSELLALTGKDTHILHCMPIHRGEEISADVINSPNSRIYTQAGNRLHTHKAVLDLLLNN